MVVTSSFDTRLEEAHLYARSVGAQVSEISAHVVNGYRSFCVFPDGSKEGWTESDDGNTQRKQISERLSALGLDWVEVCFGGDEEAPTIVGGTCES